MTVKKKLGKFGSRFLFEFLIEEKHDDIIKGFRKYLSAIQLEDIPGMVQEVRFPPEEDVDFSAVSDNVEYLEKISLVRLMKFMGEARPDLAKAIQDMSVLGAEYLAKLRLHLLELIKHPEKPLAQSTEYEPKEKMKLATCDKCGKSWPVPKEEASSPDKCPFCGAGKDD